MKPSTLLTVLFAASTTALPSPAASDSDPVRFPVPDNLTVEQGSAKCGDKAQLSCCNKAQYSGDTTEASSGVAAGALNDLLGGAGAAQGLGLFSQCSKLNVRCMSILYLRSEMRR